MDTNFGRFKMLALRTMAGDELIDDVNNATSSFKRSSMTFCMCLFVRPKSTLWLVNFNLNKNEAMLLSRKRNRPDHPTLYFDNTAIQEVTSHSHLGIYFSQKLDWQDHINYIVDSIKHSLA